jgi:hypothetical protein
MNFARRAAWDDTEFIEQNWDGILPLIATTKLNGDGSLTVLATGDTRRTGRFMTRIVSPQVNGNPAIIHCSRESFHMCNEVF